ncbi:hypothetical protein BBR47_17040 [Brevibacillus brevis NBRC 100599]|uniref:Uncharacterized protein n=1 Tax=Brevibacillus brevis (strain 47 / JCM 6285 / NBRC 100599) TaxID=358681 RepID=C0Z9L1_BREBN|nr:hypothetical protein BBR47_17040 [Brevibacillus brevis NBRC 100599]
MSTTIKTTFFPPIIFFMYKRPYIIRYITYLNLGSTLNHN